MKALTILHSLSIGGIEKTLYHCLPVLQNENIEMSICCFEKDGNLEEDFRSKGVRIVYIKKTGSFLMDFIQLFRLAKKDSYDIIHSRLSYTSGGFALACRCLKIPFFVSIHNEFAATLISWSKKPVFAQIRNSYLAIHKFLTKKYASLIIGHSRSNLDRNFPDWESSEQFKVLYNGVDFDFLAKTGENDNEVKIYLDKFNENAFTIVHVGTFKEQKNHLFMLECFSRLDPVKNNYHLILLGDGGLRKQIEDKINACGIPDNVHLVGFSKDVGAWLKYSDLFFFPSTFEGFANVLIEAQYVEVPICASGIKPHFESVHVDYHKYFFSPVDSSDCTLKLQKVIGDIKTGSCADTMKIKQYIASRFSIEQMAKNLGAIYHSFEK